MSKRAVRPVTVTTRYAEVRYDWATGVSVNKRGELRIYQGWHQRAFHPDGEWTRFTVAAQAVPEHEAMDPPPWRQPNGKTPG